MWKVTAVDQDAPPFDQFLIEFRAAQCGHSLTDRQSEELIKKKKRQNGIAKNRQVQLLPVMELSRCDEDIQRCIQFQPEKGGNLQILLKCQLEFEVTSLILLDFSVRPNGSHLVAEIATVVIRVEKVFETPRMHECLQAEGIREEDSKAQLACRIYIETDATQESFNCNVIANKWQYFVVVMNLTHSRIEGSPITSKESIQTGISAQDGISGSGRKRFGWGALLELWKPDGVTLDYESQPTIHLSVECFTKGLRSASSNITVVVIDVNEPPYFPYNLYELTILEGAVANETGNKTQISMRAIDPDAAANLRYSILNDNNDAIEMFFMIDAESGNLSARMGVEFDREWREWYNFTVMVSDGGKPALNSTAHVSIQILDTNDNLPEWIDPSQSAILEPPISEMPHGLHPPLLLYRFRAADPDLGPAGDVQFTLVEKRIWTSDAGREKQLLAREILSSWIRIELNESSGEMHLLSELDLTFINHVLELTVIAHDMAPPFNTARQNASIRFRIISRGKHPELYFLVAVLSFVCVLANIVLLFFVRQYLNRMQQPRNSVSNGSSSNEEGSSSTEDGSTSESASSDKGSSQSASSDKGSSESASSENGSSESASSDKGSSASASSDKGSSESASSDKGTSERRSSDKGRSESASPDSASCASASSRKNLHSSSSPIAISRENCANVAISMVRMKVRIDRFQQGEPPLFSISEFAVHLI